MIMKACLVVWCVVAALTVGLVHSVVAQPKGEMVYALHVTVAPAWFDPAEMPAQITPFIIGYALHDALVRALPGVRMGPALAESWRESPDGLTYEFNPTATTIFDMRVVTRYAAPVYPRSQQEAAYVTSLSDRQ